MLKSEHSEHILSMMFSALLSVLKEDILKSKQICFILQFYKNAKVKTYKQGRKSLNVIIISVNDLDSFHHMKILARRGLLNK